MEGSKKKKEKEILTITRTNRTHILSVVPKHSILIMNLDYDRQSQHNAVIEPLHHQWFVKILDLCMPPLQVHVLARQALNGSILMM